MQFSKLLLFSSILLFCMVESIWGIVPGNTYSIFNAFNERYIQANGDGFVYGTQNTTDLIPQTWLAQVDVNGLFSFQNIELGLNLDVGSDNVVRALTPTNDNSQKFILVDTGNTEFWPFPFLIQHGDYYINGDGGDIFMESIYSTGGYVMYWCFREVSV